MQRILATWLAVWAGLLLVGGACAQILSLKSSEHAGMVKTADLPITEESNKSEQEKAASRTEATEQTPVETEHGPVLGDHWKGEENIWAFIDVPYGAFETPFAAPINPKPWSEPRAIKTHTKLCPQLQPPNDEAVLMGDEDCLTLSVFTPVNANNLPVLFYIYDSNFVSDSADPLIYGPENLVSKDVIIVFPNYRLGPLGFLCLLNETAPGNAALKDLALALMWTKNNIQGFGGNPSQIAVGGEGTAGALAQYLALSPVTREYIKGVITESGSALAHWAVDRDPIATVTKLVNAMQKPITVDIDIKELLSESIAFEFRPCVETGLDSFLNESTWTILNKWKTVDRLEDIVFMIGSANHAGMQEAADQNLLHMNYDFSKFLPNDLVFKSELEKMEMSKKIRDIYIKGPIEHNRDASLYHTDASYLGPSLRTARLLAEAGATVYFYEFSYVGQLNREKHSLMEHIDVEGGAARGDIVGYTFTEEDQTSTPEDDHMIDIMTTLWTSFAKGGKPSLADNEWSTFEKASEESEVWLSIDSEPRVNSSGVHMDRLHFWTELYKNHFIENRALALNPRQFMMFLVSFVLLTVIIS